MQAATTGMGRESFSARVDFLVELARRLHAYGTTAQRLEGAISAVARRLNLECDPWSNPTGLILTFSDPTTSELTSITRVIRLEPGDVDLGKLCRADAIAEQVLAGTLDLATGKQSLRALDRPPRPRAQRMTALSFVLASAAVAGLLHAGWPDILVAASIGGLIGVLHVLGSRHPRVSETFDALAALLATLIAAAVATWWVPLSLSSVVVAALIVLLPGLALTNAVAELTSNHLVSGTARFAGAVASLFKLTFGTVVAMQLVRVLGWNPIEAAPAPQPQWVEWVALLLASYSFAVLFRAPLKDYPLVMFASALGYGVTRLTGVWLLPGHGTFPLGVFLAGLVVTAASNIYARSANRPGALIRVPGIILLVPGSIGFRSITLLMEHDMAVGFATAMSLLAALIALVAGVLFGNLLVAPRRNL